VSARATDDLTGRTLDDVVDNGVVLFMYKGDFGLKYARLELLDAEARVLSADRCTVDPDAMITNSRIGHGKSRPPGKRL
jgi:hypothetical protein